MTVFSHSIDIDAPPETVFKVLCDLGAYSEWHPSVVTACKENGKEGAVSQLGEWLVLDLGTEKKSVKIPVVVSQFENNKMLEWQGSLVKKGMLRNVFLVRHAFYVEEIKNGVTRFTNEEEFSSLLSVVVSLVKEKIIKGYLDVNMALKQRCE